MKNMPGTDPVRHTTKQWVSTAELLASAASPPGREAMWDRALTFLDAGHDDGAHLVASVIVVDAGGLVLLARHHRYPRWGPLGGHLDLGDASLRAAAARELFEEAGLVAHVDSAPIDVRLSSYRCRSVAEPVLHLDVQFVAFTTASAPALVASDELTGLEWFGAEDLQTLTPAASELVSLGVAVATLRR
jgi:8-oxo-dGTP pyrophosphatase MutT (NUDIX family)